MVQRDLFLITGIPGTGKTTYGDSFAQKFGFVHFNFEDMGILSRFMTDQNRFIQDILKGKSSTVITWGFVPNEQQIAAVKNLTANGFKLFWFDGNRTAALKAFRERGTVSEELFDAQMERIEHSRAIEKIDPKIINPFNEDEKFKLPTLLLDEMRSA
jgi:hypothetical protein